MKLIDKALFLKSTRLFQEIEFDIALSIADKLEVMELKGGEALFHKGDSAAGIYFVFQGSVRLAGDGLIEELENGDFFGDESVFTDAARGYTCAAIGSVTLLLLSKTHIFTILSECPSVATNLLALYASQISLRPRL